MATSRVVRVHRRRRASRRLAAATVCTLALGTASAAVAAPPPAAPAAAVAAAPSRSAVAVIGAQRLVQSTGNLYWTADSLNEFGPSSSSVYRAAKSGAPGGERLLYREVHGGEVTFEGLTHASVAGRWYGYFLAENRSTRTVRLLRVPLAGGAATILASGPALGRSSDLVTDGVRLFWADASGLRSMGIAGGAVRTLATNPTIAAVGLSSTHVYYATGTRAVEVPKAGGPPRTVVTAASEVTALHIRPTSTPVLHWGEVSGAVRSRPVGGATTVHQSPQTGRRVTSVSFDGTRVLWADCTTSGSSCVVSARTPGQPVRLVRVAAGSAVGVRDVQGDAAAMFWTDVSAVWRFRH